jgi:hypothetical protein
VEPVLDRASHHQNLLPLQTVATPEMAPSTHCSLCTDCTHQACKPLQATAWSVPPSLTQLVPDPDEAITATTIISLDAAQYPPACTMQRITLWHAENPLIGCKWLASIRPTTDPWRMYGDGRWISQVTNPAFACEESFSALEPCQRALLPSILATKCRFAR